VAFKLAAGLCRKCVKLTTMMMMMMMMMMTMTMMLMISHLFVCLPVCLGCS
jgi:hypothetical protein